MLSCFSQESYPKKIVIEGDTLVVITSIQLGLTNGIITERNFLRQELDLTKSILGDKDLLLTNQTLQLKNYGLAVQNYQFEVDNLNKITFEQQKIWEEQRKKLRTRNWIIGGVSISIGIVVGILICK